MEVAVIYDLSGSMKELGRKDVLKAYFLGVRHHSSAIHFYGWQEKVFPVTKVKDIQPHGTASLSALTRFLQETDCVCVLVSDGLWEKGTADEIHKVSEGHLYTVCIGIAANTPDLKKAAGGRERMWAMTDFPTLLDYLLNGVGG